MKVLEIPLYISLGAAFAGMFLTAGANLYGLYVLSQSGRHWDISNGYGICPSSGFFDLSGIGCTFSSIVNTTMRYIPPQVMTATFLTFLGFGALAMMIGDQSERVPIEVESQQ